MSEKILKINGVSVVDIAQKCGTPIMVYDEDKITKKMTSFIECFKSDEFTTKVLYASKAFSCQAIYKLAAKANMCVDVVSGGELATAKAANFPMDRVYFHGNNKTHDEIKMAFDLEIGCIVADNLDECQEIAAYANEVHKKMNVLLRVNPGVDAHTHKYIVTAHLDSKFGTSIAMKEAINEMIQTLKDSEYITFSGFHAHIGSQIFDKNAYGAEIDTMMQFIKTMEDEYNVKVNTLNLGGGFAAYYTSEDAPIPLEEVCSFILDECHKANEKYELNINTLLIEPGRSIVAEAGTTIYTIGNQKQTANKKYVFVDGGMADNIRPALYQAKYACDVVTKMDEEKTQKVTIAGKCCESGDILIEDVMIPASYSGRPISLIYLALLLSGSSGNVSLIF